MMSQAKSDTHIHELNSVINSPVCQISSSTPKQQNQLMMNDSQPGFDEFLQSMMNKIDESMDDDPNLSMQSDTMTAIVSNRLNVSFFSRYEEY